MYLKCRQFLILHVVFIRNSLLILLVSDKQGSLSQYTVRQEKAYLSVSNLLLGICLILDLFEYRPQNDLL